MIEEENRPVRRLMKNSQARCPWTHCAKIVEPRSRWGARWLRSDRLQTKSRCHGAVRSATSMGGAPAFAAAILDGGLGLAVAAAGHLTVPRTRINISWLLWHRQDGLGVRSIEARLCHALLCLRSGGGGELTHSSPVWPARKRIGEPWPHICRWIARRTFAQPDHPGNGDQAITDSLAESAMLVRGPRS